MSEGAATPKQHEIGSYTCPNTGKCLPLLSLQESQQTEWPVVVKQCASCGQTHVVRRQDVARPPVFGYE